MRSILAFALSLLGFCSLKEFVDYFMIISCDILLAEASFVGEVHDNFMTVFSLKRPQIHTELRLLVYFLNGRKYFIRLIPLPILNLFNLRPVTYFILRLVIFPFCPSIQIFINPQFHIFLPLLYQAHSSLFHELNHIL